jgi:hypothetical protein
MTRGDIVEPTEALNMAESSLRHLVRSVLGDSWRDIEGLPSEETLTARRAGEVKSRPGVEVQTNNTLDYLYIKELRHIFLQRRREFGEVFSDKPTFDALLKLLSDYRNAPSHARPLQPFENALVVGASGYIVNNITKYRNDRDDTGSYYPVILSVTDNFGTELTYGAQEPQPFEGLRSGPKLDVGQIVTFSGSGSDTRGRELTWELHIANMPYIPFDSIPRARRTGTTVELDWTVTEDDVSARTLVEVRMASSGRHHLSGTHDASRSCYYFIRPPLD